MTNIRKFIPFICLGALSVILVACTPGNNEGTPTPANNPTPQTNTTATSSVLFDWMGVPIMPGAVSGEQNAVGDYTFITAVPIEDLIAYYELHMPEMGWQQREDIETGADVTTLSFQGASMFAYLRIEPLGTNIKVTIHVFEFHGPG